MEKWQNLIHQNSLSVSETTVFLALGGKMSKFEVMLYETRSIVVTVEADDETDALNKALEDAPSSDEWEASNSDWSVTAVE